MPHQQASESHFATIAPSQSKRTWNLRQKTRSVVNWNAADSQFAIGSPRPTHYAPQLLVEARFPGLTSLIQENRSGYLRHPRTEYFRLAERYADALLPAMCFPHDGRLPDSQGPPTVIRLPSARSRL